MILEIDNVELLFGNKKILQAVYLKAEQGKVTGILGRNGSGKTCLLRILFGSLTPKYKNIRIDGKHISKALFQMGYCAYLPQHRLLPKSSKLAKVFALYDLKWEDFTILFNGFEKYAHARADQLSSGELRLVEVYLTLCSKKRIILLDEPFSFIAPVYIERLKNLIQQQKKHSMIIITDHFYEDILNISDNLYFLKGGYSKGITTINDLEKEGYILTQ